MNKNLISPNIDIIERGNKALDKGWLPCGEGRCSIALNETQAILQKHGKRFYHTWILKVPKDELIKSLEEFEAL